MSIVINASLLPAEDPPAKRARESPAQFGLSDATHLAHGKTAHEIFDALDNDACAPAPDENFAAHQYDHPEGSTSPSLDAEVGSGAAAAKEPKLKSSMEHSASWETDSQSGDEAGAVQYTEHIHVSKKANTGYVGVKRCSSGNAGNREGRFKASCCKRPCYDRHLGQFTSIEAAARAYSHHQVSPFA
jgi:hypothetical protein